MSVDLKALTPRQIVAELDKYIVGQAKAKRAVAIAMRNRYRRAKLEGEMRGEIIPKNILMIGSTGVGKTEIARRLASLAGAPFVKVEATKYTEVGYVGRDVESMVRDLVESAVRMLQEERRAEVADLADEAAVERVVDLLFPETRPPQTQAANPFAQTLGSIFGNNFQPAGMTPQQQSANATMPEDARKTREQARADVLRGFYDVRLVDIEIEETPTLPIGTMGGGMDQMGGAAEMGEMLGGLLPKRKSRKRVTVSEARRIFAQEEAGKLVDVDAIKREAVYRASEDGIIFIDEIDKVAGGREGGRGPDVSREGVQRDILPIVEGSTVPTVRSDSRIAGPLPDSRRARRVDRRRLQDDLDRAQERPDRAVPATACGRGRDARIRARRHRPIGHLRDAGQRTVREHRGAPPAHGARTAVGRRLVRRARGRGPSHDRRGLRHDPPGGHRGERRPEHVHSVTSALASDRGPSPARALRWGRSRP